LVPSLVTSRRYVTQGTYKLKGGGTKTNRTAEDKLTVAGARHPSRRESPQLLCIYALLVSVWPIFTSIDGKLKNAVPFTVCVAFVCCVLFERGVLFCVMWLIVVQLPQGINSFAVQLINNNNKRLIWPKLGSGGVHYALMQIPTSHYWYLVHLSPWTGIPPAAAQTQQQKYEFDRGSPPKHSFVLPWG
jgi:hypothetical protein